MYYVLDENRNLIEAFDKQGVLNALETAIADGSLENLVADAAFVNKLKCCVSGNTTKMAFITQAKYNELEVSGTLESNTAYFIIDDATLDNVDEQLTFLTATLNDIVQGKVAVPKAENAEFAEKDNDGNVIKDTYLSKAQLNATVEGNRVMYLIPAEIAFAYKSATLGAFYLTENSSNVTVTIGSKIYYEGEIYEVTTDGYGGVATHCVNGVKAGTKLFDLLDGVETYPVITQAYIIGYCQPSFFEKTITNATVEKHTIGINIAEKEDFTGKNLEIYLSNGTHTQVARMVNGALTQIVLATASSTPTIEYAEIGVKTTPISSKGDLYLSNWTSNDITVLKIKELIE